MKKITVLTATALTLACMGGQSLVAEASTETKSYLTPNGNRVFFTYSSNCNVENIWDKLQDCFQGITLPDCQIPEVNIPETETPEVDMPETEAPEIEAPEVNLPGNNTPDNNGGSNDNTTEENTPGDAPSVDSPSVDSQHAFIQEVVDLVNAERAKEGLSPLTIDTKVQAAAQVRAQECEQSFSHTRPNGSSFATALKEQNVSYRSAGENIAWGQRSPEQVMNAWMNSSGHRANIMNANFTTIGVGYYQNANGTNYWCQLFTR